MFFGHCHRTRFRDSFCFASVFEMTVYLLTYLPHAVCVQSLSLDGNQLTFLYTQAFHGIGGLLSLALQNNNISFLEGRSLFSNLNQLTTLSLQRNQLPRIPAGTFDGLVSLTYIDLSRNKLRSLPGAVLRRSTKLRHVYLDDNQLDMIDSCILAPHHSLSAATTRTLSVLGNPINCDCSLSWLQNYRSVALLPGLLGLGLGLEAKFSGLGLEAFGLGLGLGLGLVFLALALFKAKVKDFKRKQY